MRIFRIGLLVGKRQKGRLHPHWRTLRRGGKDWKRRLWREIRKS